MKPLNIRMRFENSLIILVLTFVLLSVGIQTVSAENNTDQSIQVVSSVPENGAVNVEPFSEISVTFNQNVVNTTVRDINATAITLWADQTKVDIDLKMSDDLVDPEDSGTIHIIPKENLKPSQLYTIKIDTNLISTEGNHLQSPVELHFTTINTANPITLTGVITAVIIILIIAAIFYGIYSKRRKA